MKSGLTRRGRSLLKAALLGGVIIVLVGPKWVMALSQVRERMSIGDARQISKRLWARMLSSGLRMDPPAPVEIVKFCSYNCSFCRSHSELFDTLHARHPGTFSVRMHFVTEPSAREDYVMAGATVCAANEGKAREFERTAFRRRPELARMPDLYGQPVAIALALAAEAGIDTVRQFASCLRSEQYLPQLRADALLSRDLGITGTPVLFVNGLGLFGAKSELELSNIVLNAVAKLKPN